MAHWYHRNPLKATAAVNFNSMKLIVADTDALKVCNELKTKRTQLLEHLVNPNLETAVINASMNEYLAVLQGLFIAPDDSGTESKLRYSIRFRWTQTLLGNTPLSQQDAIFEFVSICQDYGIWYMKHAAMIAGKDEINMDEAKEVHSCLKKAAGIFATIRDEYLPQLIDKGATGSDLDPKIMSTYIDQCTAEAQEITLARAVELKHASSLISALAYQTSKMYAASADTVTNFDQTKTAKWKMYLKLKSVFYLAFAYCYCGENLLEQEKCGEAVRSLKESLKLYEEAQNLCQDYAQAKGVGTGARADQHIFFRKLGPVVKRTLEKCERENGFIYHQKVALDVPELELKATYGLVSPEQVSLPERSPVWVPTAYAAFDAPKGNPLDSAPSKAALAAEGDLPPVKEAKVHQTEKDPKTKSGCILQ